MQHYVDRRGGQGYPPSWAEDQLMKSAAGVRIPANAVITPDATGKSDRSKSSVHAAD